LNDVAGFGGKLAKNPHGALARRGCGDASLTDDVFLRSSNWARWQLRIPPPPPER
jgi:hypothetical protein